MMISVTIGKYTFNQGHPGTIWVTKPDGEGFQIDYVKFEKVMDKFFEENM
jgi:hypothetical protein